MNPVVLDRPRVLLLETIDQESHDALAAYAAVTLARSPLAADCLDAAGSDDVHAVMTRGKGRVTAELMDRCHNLRVVARCGVGLDNVDVPAATARGIRVLNLPGANAQTMAEHTLMLMLGVQRGLLTWANAVREGAWETRARYDRDELHAKTIGIIGLGNIGRRVARMSVALGMRVAYASPSSRDAGLARVSLPELFASSDVVSLHCRLDDATRRIIDAPALASMKPGAILINTARGELIDQRALIQSLTSHRLAGFGADVLDRTDLAACDQLVALPNVIVTPHVGSLTSSTYREMCRRSVANVLAVLGGGEPEPGSVFNQHDLAR
jgi:phosphoglycerate dehydrogenase-like enzyme